MDGRACHPQSARSCRRIRSASRVGLPLTAARDNAASRRETGSSLQVLDDGTGAGNVGRTEYSAAERRAAQLFDQQVPQPERLHELSPFAAHPLDCRTGSQLARAVRRYSVTRMLPARASAAVTPIINLFRARKRCRFQSACYRTKERCKPHRDFRDRSAIRKRRLPQWRCQPPSIRLRSRNSGTPKPVIATSAAHVRGVCAPDSNSWAFDLSMGVSSDVTYPSMASAVSTQ